MNLINKLARISSISAVLCLCIGSPAIAKVAPISFDELVLASEVIILAEVESINDELDNVEVATDSINKLDSLNIATARVIESWKGPSPQTVEFLASRTWSCDISDAMVGERVVLFLNHETKPFLKEVLSPYCYHIVHSGRGRMPLRDIDGVEYATIWVTNVILPEGTPTVPGPEPEYEFIRSVELSTLRNIVEEIPSTSETQTE